MGAEAEFVIDGQTYTVDIGGSPAFAFGKHERLAGPDTDIAWGQDWYEQGFGIRPFCDEAAFADLRAGISASIAGILDSLGIDTRGFELEKYHHFVRDDATHHRVVGITRDLFPGDFNFPIAGNIDRLGALLGFALTDTCPWNGEQVHIIVRINRPRSGDYNPPHKDIYENWDADRVLRRFVNFWIPVCGVGPRSSLPLVPGSHQLDEDRIYRTFQGGVVGGNRYRVRNIIRWDDRNDLCRPPVRYGEVLVFSSHLIHGCAINSQDDTTRVALEFRLFKRN
jgi:hypothetical protein